MQSGQTDLAFADSVRIKNLTYLLTYRISWKSSDIITTQIVLLLSAMAMYFWLEGSEQSITQLITQLIGFLNNSILANYFQVFTRHTSKLKTHWLHIKSSGLIMWIN